MSQISQAGFLAKVKSFGLNASETEINAFYDAHAPASNASNAIPNRSFSIDSNGDVVVFDISGNEMARSIHSRNVGNKELYNCDATTTNCARLAVIAGINSIENMGAANTKSSTVPEEQLADAYSNLKAIGWNVKSDRSGVQSMDDALKRTDKPFNKVVDYLNNTTNINVKTLLGENIELVNQNPGILQQQSVDNKPLFPAPSGSGSYGRRQIRPQVGGNIFSMAPTGDATEVLIGNVNGQTGGGTNYITALQEKLNSVNRMLNLQNKQIDNATKTAITQRIKDMTEAQTKIDEFIKNAGKAIRSGPSNNVVTFSEQELANLEEASKVASRKYNTVNNAIYALEVKLVDLTNAVKKAVPATAPAAPVAFEAL